MDTGVDNPDLLYPEEVRIIIGCAMTVYNTLGIGFLEGVYHDALEVELGLQGIPFEHKKHLDVFYKGVKLPCFYEADVICYGKIILEIKAISRLTEIDDAQLINYLKATGIQVGILINFGKKGKLDWKRFVYTNDHYFKKDNVPK